MDEDAMRLIEWEVIEDRERRDLAARKGSILKMS